MRLNGQLIKGYVGKRVIELPEVNYYDIYTANGFPVTKDYRIQSDDEIIMIKKGVLPRAEELEVLLQARHTPKVYWTLKKAKVGIAGVGGLGSHVALALARAGVGHLVLVDYDVVEPSNLNRQCYMIEDIGKSKVEALETYIKKINPAIQVTTENKQINRSNAATTFRDCKVVVEAFDTPATKALFIEELLHKTKIPIVSGSGLAGLYDPNEIRTQLVMKRLYVCGDGTHGADQFEGLMAPRVMVAAGHQSTTVCQILLEQEEEKDA